MRSRLGNKLCEGNTVLTYIVESPSIVQVATPAASAQHHGRDKRWSGGDRRGSEPRNTGGSDSGNGFPANAPNARVVERDGGGADRGART